MSRAEANLFDDQQPVLPIFEEGSELVEPAPEAWSNPEKTIAVAPVASMLEEDQETPSDRYWAELGGGSYDSASPFNRSRNRVQAPIVGNKPDSSRIELPTADEQPASKEKRAEALRDMIDYQTRQKKESLLSEEGFTDTEMRAILRTRYNRRQKLRENPNLRYLN
jgi:hypothetical protein